MYRLFVAIDVPPEVRTQLARISYGLPGAKWADDSQLHVTIRFIGEVDGGVMRDVDEGLRTIKLPPIELHFNGMGVFPPRKRPEQLWIGIRKDEGLLRLRNRIEAALERSGVKRESRKFAPHVGLARLKGTPPEKLAQFLTDVAFFKPDSFVASEFCLFSSVLSSQMALHEVEAAYPLDAIGSNQHEELS